MRAGYQAQAGRNRGGHQRAERRGAARDMGVQAVSVPGGQSSHARRQSKQAHKREAAIRSSWYQDSSSTMLTQRCLERECVQNSKNVISEVLSYQIVRI